MEIVAVIIMLTVGLNLLLKLTWLPPYGRAVVCVLCAVAVFLSVDLATEQSKTQISDWLANPELMLDVAVLLTIDVIIQFSFCFLTARMLAGEPTSKAGRIFRLLSLWVPGVMILPTLFALLVEVIFALPGFDFQMIGGAVAAAVLILGMTLPTVIHWIVPEKDVRLELIFMVNALTALLGLVATVNGRTAVDGTNAVEWMPLLTVVIIVATAAAIGFFLYKRKLNKHLSHNK